MKVSRLTRYRTHRAHRYGQAATGFPAKPFEGGNGSDLRKTGMNIFQTRGLNYASLQRESFREYGQPFLILQLSETQPDDNFLGVYR